MMKKELEKIKKRTFGRKKLTLQSTKNDIRDGRLILSNPDNSITALVSFGPLSRMLNYRQGLREYARVMKKSTVAAIGVWLGKNFSFKGTQYYHKEKRFKQDLEVLFTIISESILYDDGKRKFVVYRVKRK